MRLSRHINNKRGTFADKCNKSKVGSWETAICFHKCLLLFFKVSAGHELLEWWTYHSSRAPHNFIMSLLTELLPDSYYRAAARLWCLNRKCMALRRWFGCVLHLLKRPCTGPVMTKLGVSDRSNVTRSRLQLQIARMHARFLQRSCAASCFLANRWQMFAVGVQMPFVVLCAAATEASPLLDPPPPSPRPWCHCRMVVKILEKMRTSLNLSWALHVSPCTLVGLHWFNFTLLHPRHSTPLGLMLIFIAVASQWKEQSKTKLAEQRNFSVAVLSPDRRPRLWASFLLRSLKTPCLRTGDATCLPKGGDTMSTPPTTVSP